MRRPVANEGAVPRKAARVAKLKPPGRWFRTDDDRIEIDQVRVVPTERLGSTHPVRIMAGRTGRALLDDVIAMRRKALIRENAGLLVAFVAHRVLIF